MKIIYFEQIYSGAKGVEFRADTDHWTKTLKGKTHVVFQRGHLFGFRHFLQLVFVSDDCFVMSAYRHNSDRLLHCFVFCSSNLVFSLKTQHHIISGMTATKTTPRRILSIKTVSIDEAVSMGCPAGKEIELFGGAEKVLAIQFEQFSEDPPAEAVGRVAWKRSGLTWY